MEEKRKQIRISDKYKGIETLPINLDDFTEIRHTDSTKDKYGKDLVAEIIKKNLGAKISKEPDFNHMVEVIYDALLLKAKEDKNIAEWVMHYLNPPFGVKVIH